MELFRSHDQESVDEYWQRMGEELGEPILAYVLGRYVSGFEQDGPLWGLLYFTSSRLFFRHFGQTNWFSGLLQSGGSSDSRSREVTLEVPLERFLSLVAPPKPNLLARIFGGNEENFRLVSNRPDVSEFVFSVEDHNGTFIPQLTDLLSESD